MIRQNFSQRWALAAVILSWALMPRQINAASGYVQHNLASDWAQFPARRLRHIAGKLPDDLLAHAGTLNLIAAAHRGQNRAH
jgi:hypothetical protein